MRNSRNISLTKVEPRLLVGGATKSEQEEISDLCIKKAIKVNYCSSVKHLKVSLACGDVYLE